MVSFEEALRVVLSSATGPDHHLPLMGSEQVPLSESLGRILAEEVHSDIDMPPFDKSAMDGYACRKSDLQIPSGQPQNFTPLQIIETIPAGTIATKIVGSGQCSKIMTGSMIPQGADCVVKVEDTVISDEHSVHILSVSTTPNICFQGEDIRKGTRVLQRGLEIGPAHIAVLAAVGRTQPVVAKLPRIGIISTGDELVEPEAIPGRAQIRNSNSWQLAAQLKGVPSLSTYYGIAPDEGPALRKIIDLALKNDDVVLLTGGVSMGDYDFVPSVMVEAGVEILFESIAIQPGKPTVFGHRDNKFIFGLPGNPVSSFVLFEILVKPFVRRLMGDFSEAAIFTLPMGTGYTRRKSERKSFIPVIIRDGVVFPVEYHGSAHINAYTLANGILELEIGTISVNKGELVHVRPL